MKPFISITFPQGFQIWKNIGHPTSGSGGKKRLSGTSKVYPRTDKHFNLKKASADALKICFLISNIVYQITFFFLTTPKQKLNFAHTLYMAQIEGKH